MSTERSSETDERVWRVTNALHKTLQALYPEGVPANEEEVTALLAGLAAFTASALIPISEHSELRALHLLHELVVPMMCRSLSGIESLAGVTDEATKPSA